MLAKQIRPIVPIERWLNDEFYVGKEKDYVRPYVKDFLIDFFSGDKRKFIATGASRTGKSYGARFVIMRIIYEVSCFEHFPCLFGLSPSTLPKIFWISYTLDKAGNTGIKNLMTMIDNTPYFQQRGLKRSDSKTEIKFPFLEVVNGSNITHITGEDMLGCILDEANIRLVRDGTQIENAQKMFAEMRQRSVMTYSKNGIWGGFTGIISSTTDNSSFVAVEMEKAKEKKDTVIMEASIYVAHPEQFSKETFDVFIGDGTIKPFIVDKLDDSIKDEINDLYGVTVQDYLTNNPHLVEKVPVSIREFYEEDIEFALANMSGKASNGKRKWIRNVSLIKNMFNDKPKTLREEHPLIGIYDLTDLGTCINIDKINESYNGEEVFMHIDASQKHDFSGISGIYYDSIENKVKDIVNVSCTITKNKKDNQIDQVKIFDFIIYLWEQGINIRYVSGDHYAKDYLIPQLKKRLGDDYAGYLSVDKDDTAYMMMLNLMRKKLYSFRYYERLEYELKNLIDNNGKIDHPHNTDSINPIYFKDVSDGVAGATYNLLTKGDLKYEEVTISQNTEIEDWYSDIGIETDEYLDDKDMFDKDLKDSLYD